MSGMFNGPRLRSGLPYGRLSRLVELKHVSPTARRSRYLFSGRCVIAGRGRVSGAEDAPPSETASAPDVESPADPPAEAATSAEPVDFLHDIRPILSDNCFMCHGPDANHREAGLRLDVREGAFGETEYGDLAIVPGEREASAIWERISSDDEFMVMPPPDSGKSLTPEQVELLGRWIDEGAAWQEHWAFVTPERPELPAVQQADWPANAIDYFTLARLERAGLSPSPQADKETLIRRVTFDLTGLAAHA